MVRAATIVLLVGCCILMAACSDAADSETTGATQQVVDPTEVPVPNVGPSTDTTTAATDPPPSTTSSEVEPTASECVPITHVETGDPLLDLVGQWQGVAGDAIIILHFREDGTLTIVEPPTSNLPSGSVTTERFEPFEDGVVTIRGERRNVLIRDGRLLLDGVLSFVPVECSGFGFHR